MAGRVSDFGVNSHKYLKHTMLRGPLRQYMIDHAKKPLMRFLVAIAKRWPDPTYINVSHPNSRLLLAIRDKFISLEDNPQRIELFKAVFKIVICVYDHDPYYRTRADWIIEEIVEYVFRGHWKPRQINAPRNCWREEQPYGMNEGRLYKDYIKVYISEDMR